MGLRKTAGGEGERRCGSRAARMRVGAGGGGAIPEIEKNPMYILPFEKRAS